MRKIFFTLAFFYISLFTFDVSSQSITWQKIYDGPAHRNDGARDVCESSDGFYYVVGNTFVMGLGDKIYVLKLNQYGDTIWTKIIGNTISGPSLLAYAVAPTNDGGCVITGQQDSSFSFKLGSSGAIVWQKFYGGSYRACLDIKRTSDGGYIACGYDNSSIFQGYVLKIDPIGNLQWQRTYTGGNVKIFREIEEAYDGGYILVGNVFEYSQDTNTAYILKIDTVGNIIWEKRFRLNNRGTFIVSISKIQNGYLVGGNIYAGTLTYQPFLVKISITGDTLFKNIYSDTSYLHQIRPISPSRFVMTTTRDSNVPPPISLNEKARVVVSDSTGVILHEKVFFNGKYDELTTELPLANGDIIFSGYTEPPTSQFMDVYIVRTDSNLNAPPIGIEPIGIKIPSSFKFYQNYPNPFNSSTIIKFDIEANVNNAKLIIYDILGRQIAVLINQSLKPGSYEIKWNAHSFSSGIYSYSLFMDQKRISKLMVLVK